MRERYIISIVDENFDILLQAQDYLFLDMTRTENSVGALIIRLPIRYDSLLRNLGLLESISAAISMPRFFIHVYQCLLGNSGCCLWEDAVWIIDKPARVLEEDGNCYIQLEAADQMELLNYRSVYADEDSPFAERTGAADTVMHQVFVDQFGDAQGLDPRRDWIAGGCVADGIDPSCGFSPYEQRLEFKGTLLKIFQDAAKASTTNNLPLFFDLVPTLIPTQFGSRASLPLVFNTYCGHRSTDRTVNNPDGNTAVMLSTQTGTIGSFTIGPDFRSDHSVAMAVGSGSGASQPRQIRVNDVRVDSTKWGWKESITTDRDAEDQTDVDASADEYLEEGKSRGQLIVELTDSPAVRYGMPDCGGNFRWGDCITICDETTAINVRIVAVNITIEDGDLKRVIKLEVTDEQPE